MQRILRSVLTVGLLAVALPAAAQNPGLAGAMETLRLSIDEWKREDAAYRAARGAAKISAADAQEYAGFVASLRLRVLEQCETVRRLGGEEAVRDFECVRVGPEERIAVIVAPAAVQTEEEKRAALQARLDQLEGDIDDSLQKRQQDIRQKASTVGSRASSSGTGSGTGAGGAASGGGASSAAPGSTWGPPPPEGGSKSPEGQAGAAGERPASTASTGASRPSGSAGGRSAQRQAPSDGGSDDDVVARQLREAAEKETDPVLKEKLWDEYRKYKEGKR